MPYNVIDYLRTKHKYELQDKTSRLKDDKPSESTRAIPTQSVNKKEDIPFPPVEPQRSIIEKEVSPTVEQKYCFKCGKKIVSDAKLCPYCGTAQNTT